MQILNFFITAGINIGVACVFFFFLLLALNGSSERQANPGLVLYIVWALLASVVAATLSVFTAKYLIGKKSFKPIGAIAIASAIFIIVGGGASFLGTIVALLLVGTGL